jgi:hypothetical protein
MHAMTTVSTRSIPLVPTQMAAPPPSRHELTDDGTVVGWVDGRAIGFRGFGDEAEAAHAAWVGYRTMSRRFPRPAGQRPIPIGSEPLSFDQSGGVELILAAGRPIATLVRPGVGSPSGRESFGFELQLPVPADERTTRSTADVVYRTIRRSGIRWTMWMTVKPLPAAIPVNDGQSVAAAPPLPAARRAGAAAAGSRAAMSSSLATALIVLALFAMIGLPAITASAVTGLLGGVAAIFAIAAVATLVHLVVVDTRDVLRERGRATTAADGSNDRRARAAGQGRSGLRQTRPVAIRSAS